MDTVDISMHNPEHNSPPLWEEALKLSARIAAPFALAWVASHAVFRISDGARINLSIPADRQPVRTKQEKRMIGLLRQVDKHIRRNHDRHGLEVEYESIAVSQGDENPARSKNALPHHRPDFAIALSGTLPCFAPAPIRDLQRIAAVEVGQTVVHNSDKTKQADHAQKAGLPNYHQFDDDGITRLFRDFNQDPDSVVLALLGEAAYR